MIEDDDFGIIVGTGNVFRDTGVPNPDLEQLRTILAAEIMKILDREGLTVRKAEEITGIAAADFSRIRRLKLGRFTIDRLMIVLHKLGQRVEVEVTVRPEAEALKDDEIAKAAIEREFAQRLARKSGKDAA